MAEEMLLGSDEAPESVPPPYQSRNEAFGQGSAPSTPPGLTDEAARMNALTPRYYRANGLNQQVQFSGIGSSFRDQGRQLYNPGPISPVSPHLITNNGISANTYERARPFLSTSLSLEGTAQ